MVCVKGQVVTVLLLVGLLLAGMAGNGSAQQSPATVQKLEDQPSAQQKMNKPPTSLRNLRLGLEIYADMNVTPLLYSGPCPAVFTFTGTFKSNKPLAISYRLVRSDNTRTLPITLVFERPGKKEIKDTWQMGGDGTSGKFGGWESIQIISPMKMESNVAYFKGTCSGTGQPAAAGSTGQQATQQGKPGQKYIFIGPTEEPTVGQKGQEGSVQGTPALPMNEVEPLPGGGVVRQLF